MVCSYRRLWAGVVAHRVDLTNQLDMKLDIVSTYPTVSQILNMGRETLVMEFSMIKGVSEYHRRELGVNMTAGLVNAVEICQKTMKGTGFDDMLKAYKESKAA